jgi:hypothetical protein
MSRDFIRTPKPLDDMTPEEKVEYIDEINELFTYCLVAAPFIEIGESAIHTRKLRANIDEGTYSVGEMIFELQMELYRYQQRHPEHEWRMIVSELQLTPDLRSEHFCPRMGVMLKVKFEER